jgi:hypothetical protein
MVMGGIFRIDVPNTISGSGSVADQNLAGALTSGATLSGTVTAPDSFGSLKLNLTTSFAPTPIQFNGYIVDDVHIKLIESDNTGGTGIGSTAGVAIGQGTSTGTFTANQSFAGDYVFGIRGEDFSGLPSSLGSVGQFTADANGNLTGYNDEGLNGLGITISDSLTGSYIVDPRGTGRVDSSVNFDSNGPGPEFIFYLTGNGNPALVLDSDLNIGSVGVGLAPMQAAPLSFDGSYGLSFTQGNGGLENDATGQITVDGAASNLAGLMDTNLSFSPQLNTSIAGSFGAISPNGRFTGGLTNTFFPTPGTEANTLAVAFYLVDSGHGYFLETDSLYSGELMFGSFATRTPVCPTCLKASKSRRSSSVGKRQ